MSLTLYLLRHGETACNHDNVVCGALDPELTVDGLEMAKAFAYAYYSKPWTAIYSSPMRRTVTTAKFICDALGMDMQLRDGLREINYGKWEGKTLETINNEYHDDYIRWTNDPVWNAPTQGELVMAIAQRSLQIIQEIKQLYNTGNVLIVSHKATIRIILCNLLGIDMRDFRYRLGCAVGSVSIVEFGPQGALLKTLSDQSHLPQHLRK